MESKKKPKFQFHFYFSRGLGNGIEVDLLSNSEKEARIKLRGLITDDYDAKLQRVTEV